MSLVKTVDVECDYRGCGRWAEGVSGGLRGTNGVTARRAAKFVGFVRRKVDGERRDLCPDHAHVTDLGGRDA